jgi:hypothetical protein
MLGEHCDLLLLWCSAFKPWSCLEPVVLVGLVCPPMRCSCAAPPRDPPSSESRPSSWAGHSCRCQYCRCCAHSFLPLLPSCLTRTIVTQPPWPWRRHVHALALTHARTHAPVPTRAPTCTCCAGKAKAVPLTTWSKTSPVVCLSCVGEVSFGLGAQAPVQLGARGRVPGCVPPHRQRPP